MSATLSAPAATPEHSKPVRTGGPTNLRAITFHLLRARFGAGFGEGILYLGAILSSLVTAALTLTVAGGTWMFYQRWQHPYGILRELSELDPMLDLISQYYFILALIACVLLAPSAARLTANATILGAKGREERLASLRLIGLSGQDVTRMALLEASVQAVVGTLLGTIVYLVTLPLWHRMEMQALPIQASEMLLPWWFIVILDLVLVAIAVAASAVGMRRVKVSPLGVARKARSMRLGKWRPIVMVIGVVAGFMIVFLGAQKAGAQLGYWMAGGFATAILGFVVGVPWLFEKIAGLAARVPWPSGIVAARRVQADAKGVWNKVGPMVLLAFIAGVVCYVPFGTTGEEGGDSFDAFASRTSQDVQRGVLLTLAIGFIIAAVSTLIGEAAEVLDRAEETRSFKKMGVHPRFSTRVSWQAQLVPLALGTIIAAALGAALALPAYRGMREFVAEDTAAPEWVVVVVGAGLLLTMLALAATLPLRRRVADRRVRRND